MRWTLLPVVLVVASCVQPLRGAPVRAVTAPEAEAIARRHLAQAVPPEASAVISEEPDAFIVTFPATLDPGVRGGDFRAQVRVRRATGEVLETRLPP